VKRILQEIIVYAFAIFICSQFFGGISVDGGLGSYLLASFLLVIAFSIVKPILTIISFPLNMATLGAFSFVILALTLFIVTHVYPKIHVIPFIIRNISVFGFEAKNVHVSSFLSYFVISATIYLISKLVFWLFE